MLRRRRPLLRAAMLGGTGYAAYRAGKGVQQRSHHESEQDAQLAGLQQQQAEAPAAPPPSPTPPSPTPPPAVVAPADAAARRIEALSQLKQLLDGGVLSQQEFDGQKQQILQGT